MRGATIHSLLTVSQIASHPARREGLASLCRDVETLPLPCRLPTSMRHEVIGLDVEHCKALASNAAPILYRFKPAPGGAPVPMLIAKVRKWCASKEGGGRSIAEWCALSQSGDDLRQDQFIMMAGSVLNRIFSHAKLDLHLVTYSVMALGEVARTRSCRLRCCSRSVLQRDGLIEVVPNCTPLSKIHGNSLRDAMRNDNAIADWLRHSSPDAPWAAIVDRFVSTLAASCIFEYVLGLGDRHSDNVLMQPDGTIFHVSALPRNRFRCISLIVSTLSSLD